MATRLAVKDKSDLFVIDVMKGAARSVGLNKKFIPAGFLALAFALLPQIGVADHGIGGDFGYEVPQTIQAAGEWNVYVQAEDLDEAHSLATTCAISPNTCLSLFSNSRWNSEGNGLSCMANDCSTFFKSVAATLEKMQELHVNEFPLLIPSKGLPPDFRPQSAWQDYVPLAALPETGKITEGSEWALEWDETLQKDAVDAVGSAAAVFVACSIWVWWTGVAGEASCTTLALLTLAGALVVAMIKAIIGAYSVRWNSFAWTGESIAGVVQGSVTGQISGEAHPYQWLWFGGNNEAEYVADKDRARERASELARIFMPLSGPASASLSIPLLDIDVATFTGTGAVGQNSDGSPDLVFEGSMETILPGVRLRAELSSDGAEDVCSTAPSSWGCPVSYLCFWSSMAGSGCPDVNSAVAWTDVLNKLAGKAGISADRVTTATALLNACMVPDACNQAQVTEILRPLVAPEAGNLGTPWPPMWDRHALDAHLD